MYLDQQRDYWQTKRSWRKMKVYRLAEKENSDKKRVVSQEFICKTRPTNNLCVNFMKKKRKNYFSEFILKKNKIKKCGHPFCAKLNNSWRDPLAVYSEDN